MSGGEDVGENLYGGMGDSHSYTVASVDAWYSEVEEYMKHEGDSKRNASAGHFTQVGSCQKTKPELNHSLKIFPGSFLSIFFSR